MKQKGIHKKLQLYMKFNLNNKGFSLVESIIAIALIGIISIVVTSLFFSMSRISKFSDEQLKRNAIIKVIKENVNNSVRKNTDIAGTSLRAPSTVGDELTNLKVTDLSDQEYPEYTYNLKLVGYTESNVRQYKVTLVSTNDIENTFEFQFEIYK